MEVKLASGVVDCSGPGMLVLIAAKPQVSLVRGIGLAILPGPVLGSPVMGMDGMVGSGVVVVGFW